jgi:hypothetical protein
MNKSESIAAISAAIAKAQNEVENASKNAKNPHFKSKYADLAELLNTVRPVFSSHGLAIVQMPSFVDGIASVETMISHSSGEWISSICSSPVGKQDAQGVGSAITYLRRYSLAAMCGIAQEDDDANSAVGHAPQTQQAPKPQTPQAKPEISSERLAKAIEAIQAGKATKESVINNFTLTDAQHAAIMEA